MTSSTHIFWAILLFASFLTCDAALAVEKEYLLGPGDIVKVTVYDHPDLAVEARISQGDTITFPLIGEVKIGGGTTVNAEATIAKRLSQGGFVTQAQVNVVVTQFHSQQVYILGQVNKPGKYTLEGASTILEMIAIAGGVSKDGADRAVLVHQGHTGPVRKDIDLLRPFYPDAAIESGKARGTDATTIDVTNDDVIFVPRSPRFYVYGEVHKPGVYRLERHMTVMQALSVAGGFTQRANDGNVTIKRRGEKGNVQTIPAGDLTKQVKADDVIYVKASLF